MPRPRTVNKKIPDLPRGMRKVREKWFWRGTDALTIEIQKRLQAGDTSMFCGLTPVAARVWWEKEISPALVAAVPDSDVAGTVEELIRSTRGTNCRVRPIGHAQGIRGAHRATATGVPHQALPENRGPGPTARIPQCGHDHPAPARQQGPGGLESSQK